MAKKTSSARVTKSSSVDTLNCEFDLEQFVRPDDEGQTVAEMVAQSGRSLQWVRDALKSAKVAQRLTVGRRRVLYIDERRGFVPVYKVLDAKPTS